MISILITLFFSLTSAAELAPDCGAVATSKGSEYGEASHWVLGDSLALAEPGAVKLVQANGTRASLSFATAEEVLVHSFRVANRAYLLTRTPRGYALYRREESPDSLVRLRTGELIFREGARTVAGPLVDAWVDQEKGQILLLGAFVAQYWPLAGFVDGSGGKGTERSLPPKFGAHDPLPAAIFPWGKSRDWLVLQASPDEGHTWSLAYGLKRTDLSLQPDKQGILPGDHLARLRNRADSFPLNWLVLGRTFVDASGEAGPELNAYPVDAFATKEEWLITYFDLGTFYFRHGQLVCRAFPGKNGGPRSAILLTESTSTGRQKVFLGIDREGHLLRSVRAESESAPLALPSKKSKALHK